MRGEGNRKARSTVVLIVSRVKELKLTRTRTVKKTSDISKIDKKERPLFIPDDFA